MLTFDVRPPRNSTQRAFCPVKDDAFFSVRACGRQNADAPLRRMCAQEEECVENLFDALAAALLVPDNQQRFRQGVGLYLFLY